MEGLRVLFVDDEDDFRETIVKRLNARKIQAMGAESGVRALEIVKDNDFDVIVLDVKMPGMDGIETLRHIKQMKPEIEVIMLTGHASVEFGLKGMQLGVRLRDEAGAAQRTARHHQPGLEQEAGPALNRMAGAAEPRPAAVSGQSRTNRVLARGAGGIL